MVKRELTGGIYFGEKSRIDLPGGGQKPEILWLTQLMK